MTCDKTFCTHCYPSSITTPPTPTCLVLPPPASITNCLQASSQNSQYCARCKPGYVLAEGNSKCATTSIENCVSGVILGSNVEICSVCAFYHPSDDFRQCSKSLQVKNCLFGGLSYSELVKFRSKENLFTLSLKNEVVTNLDPSFYQQIEGTASVEANIALSERLQNYRSTCATCLPGYSKYSDNIQSCSKECVSGCDLCSGSKRGNCLKCKEWLGFYETEVSKDGYVKCFKFLGRLIIGWKIFGFLIIMLEFS